MRTAALLFLAIPVFAQIANRSTPAAAAMPANAGSAPILSQGKSARIPLSAFVTLERIFDGKLAGLADANGPIDLLGATRGIYLDGYGAVFTTEMGLIVTPTVNPFNNTISEAQKTRVHSAKISRLPLLRKMIVDNLRDMAVALTQVPKDQQIVLAVRLDYLGWENTTGLPGLITAHADRQSAAAGNIQIEEQ
jgi:hypothetical protein